MSRAYGSIPAESAYAKVISDVLRWSSENPGDWMKTWLLIQDKWDKADVCVDGALDPFNIGPKLNGGYAPHQISQPGISRPQS